MKTKEHLEGFVLLNDTACCVLTAGMSSPDIDKELAYQLGEILGIAFRTLYDFGESLVHKVKFLFNF
ncbi:MAG: hypothetical protein WBK97_03700 [Bacteroidales bacterium]|jgi:hypothetical protein